MTTEDFYESAIDLLNIISDNIISIQVVTQAVLVVLCGLCLYCIFWGRK